MVDYDRAKQIFTKAVELAREDRGAYLDEHCADDADLRAQVEELQPCGEATCVRRLDHC